MKHTRQVQTKTADYTVKASESGTIFISGAADNVFTLPATEAGLRYTFVTKTVSASTGTSISPAAADAIHHTTSVDDKDLINSGASDVEGDSVTLVGDGAEGWWVESIFGTWAKEA
jgi:hypothetical protein